MLWNILKVCVLNVYITAQVGAILIGTEIILKLYMHGIIKSKEKIMPNMKDYTKISISKDLHELIRDICAEKGLKMYHFEDQAIKKYVEQNYPEYVKTDIQKA